MEKSKQARTRERKLRAKYRRRLRIAIVLCLIIGLAGGFVAGRVSAGAPINPLEQSVIFTRSTPEVTTAPTPVIEATDAPTAEPTAEPTAVPTAEPTAVPTAEPTATPAPAVMKTVVPFGETQQIAVQVYGDGTVRKEADALPFETINFSLRVTRHLTNDYYADTYGSTHRLNGSEAGVEFELMVNDYMNTTVALDPNKLLKITGVEDTEGNISLGYLFTDKEISGADDFTLVTNVPTMVYKRYNHSEAEIKYLTVTTYVDGAAYVYQFELGAPVAEATATPAPTATAEPMAFTEMKLGSRGDDVTRLQNRLIELGYLAEGAADGAYGNMTYNAVMKAQRAMGMEDDGISTIEFQEKLFAAN